MRFNITIITMLPLKPHMVLVSFMFDVIVGKGFAENSRSTNLQRVAFLSATAFLTKRILGFKCLNDRGPIRNPN